MKSRLMTIILTLMTALMLPLSAMAQDAHTPVVTSLDDEETSVSDEASAEDATEIDETVNAEVAETADADAADKKDDKAKEEDDKGWSVYAAVSFDIGLGAFVSHEYARKIRSRFAFEFGGSYTIPVIDVDVYAKTGFSQWMSKAGGTNGQYEFRWADSAIGFSRNIWEYKSGVFGISFDADLGFMVPTSTASINMKQYTSIIPSVAMTIQLDKFKFAYAIAYSHNFHKYTSIALNPNEVDVLSRSTGTELLGTTAVAVGGILTEIELVNQFVLGYQFLDCFGLNVGLGIVDAWSYDNGTNTSGDEFTNPNAHIGRGHTQMSQGIVALNYVPVKYVALSLSMVSTQPWKTADNKTYRFPWFDTVSPSNNYTKFMLSATFTY